MTTLICDCNQTLPLDPARLGQALDENLNRHSLLCRGELGAFVKALQSGQSLVVACTQEKHLFAELAQRSAAPGARAVPMRFVNIRETAGWSREGTQAGPKMAALLASAQLLEPEPVATVSYRSAGRLLMIGELDACERAAALLGEDWDISMFTQGPGDHGAAQARRYPVLGGRIVSLTGWLGAFDLKWSRDNPIDLDLCTRCNACLAVCPEGAIGLDYQIRSSVCKSHRACLKVCKTAGAIDFSRVAELASERFDLVLDLRATPAFTQHALPQGYLRWDGRNPAPLLQLRTLVGEFEKPRFFEYQKSLCAHSRNQKTGCTACLDVCSAAAISSDLRQQQITVQAHLCVGCGTCTSVCPSGALRYNYPRASAQGVKLKTLLGTFARSAGTQAALLLHSQGEGTRLLDDLGRAAQLERGLRDGMHGLPARVLPMALWHTSSLGLEAWLTAIAYGARQVWVLMTAEEAPQYHEAIGQQMAIGQAIMSGLGYAGQHFRLLHVRDARDLAALDADLRAAPAQGVARSASFAIQTDKRATLELALDHLIEQAPARPASPIALPASGAPLGTVIIDKLACTLCLSCVGACPSTALLDNPDAPQLRFVEKNCVQCGLCVKTCPEHAIALLPRLNLSAARRQAVLLHEGQAYGCVRCGKPFGTVQAVEAMLSRLASHSMFQGAAARRLRMCADCRVIDIDAEAHQGLAAEPRK